ncbi:hypothetical protein Droror1_Dr00028120, partial [Drosera rotundifolia]
MAAFRETSAECNLYDIGYDGYTYTWDNEIYPPFNVKCRLDRVVEQFHYCWSAQVNGQGPHELEQNPLDQEA